MVLAIHMVMQMNQFDRIVHFPNKLHYKKRSTSRSFLWMQNLLKCKVFLLTARQISKVDSRALKTLKIRLYQRSIAGAWLPSPYDIMPENRLCTFQIMVKLHLNHYTVQIASELNWFLLCGNAFKLSLWNTKCLPWTILFGWR